MSPPRSEASREGGGRPGVELEEELRKSKTTQENLHVKINTKQPNIKIGKEL